MAVDSAGNVYVSDGGNSEVRKVSPSGRITRIVGDGTPCSTAPACGDGDAATGAQLDPRDVAVDSAGNVYVADTNDHEVRQVSPDGTITRIAGNGTRCRIAPACGDGRAATSAQLSFPEGLAVDATGKMYIADSGDQEVRFVGPAGRLVLVAFRARACPARVIVRYRLRLASEARIVLSVKAVRASVRGEAGPPTVVVARSRGRGGVDGIAWNRRLHGRRARHGRYELIVTATVGRLSVSSVLTTRL